jgi:hypothetical protein
VLAAAVAMLPATAVLAQTAGSSTADGSRLGGPTGAPTTPSPGGVTASENSNVPGATGRTVVPGSNSTVAGDARGTELNKTGAMSGQSGGGGSGGK